jgi:hypothetical protein
MGRYWPWITAFLKRKFGASLGPCGRTRPRGQMASSVSSFRRHGRLLSEMSCKLWQRSGHSMVVACISSIKCIWFYSARRKTLKKSKDYRSVSLIHSFSKLFAKLLSSRLASHIHRLVLPNQSAFICGRAIHNNFQAVQSSAKLLHARGISCVLLKVDIAKAFDVVNWSFLHDLLNHLGFTWRWINWVACLLSMASTRIILNGQPGQRICHVRGLRQGDPLSLLLFVLVMEVLNGLFHRADLNRLFTPLYAPSIKFYLSLYA